MSRRNRSFSGSARRRSGSDADLDITPMIDVTFLLLIFFMVTSTMTPTRDVNVPVAEYGVGVSAGDSTIITVKSPEGNAQPVIELGEDSGEFGSLEEIAPFIGREAAEGRTQVIIKADRDAPHGFVQQVAQQVTSVEGVQMSYGVKDKQN